MAYEVLYTQYQNDVTKTLVGTPDHDSYWAETYAYDYEYLAETTTSRNTINLSGEGGGDWLGANTFAVSAYGNSVSVSGNTSNVSGGEGADFLSGQSYSLSYSGGTATASGNTTNLSGGTEGDQLYAYHTSHVQNGGKVFTTNNVIVSDGGAGSDHLEAHLGFVAYDTGSMTFTGNHITLNGGEGDDTLRYTAYKYDNGAAEVSGNTVLLDGGEETDGRADNDTAYFTDWWGFGAARDLATYAPTLNSNGDLTLTDPVTGSVLTVRNVENLQFEWYEPNSEGLYSYRTTSYTYEQVLTLINQDPTAVNDTAAVQEDESVEILALANDSDPNGDALNFTSATSALGATVSWMVNDDGQRVLLYSADRDAFDAMATGATKVDTITYTISDGKGGTDTATVQVTVTAVADGVNMVGANGGNGIDTLTGQQVLVKGVLRDRDETLLGYNGNDILKGEGGADRAIGGNGDDLLDGGDGWDELLGERGNDRLIGGRGNDVQAGGQGADAFEFGAHVVNGTDAGSGTDQILDFQIGVDRIVFRDGVSVAGMGESDVNGDSVMDTVLTLSNSSQIQLLGVNGLGENWGGLVA